MADLAGAGLAHRTTAAEVDAEGAAFLTLFASNMTIGRIGALYEHLTPAGFWLMNALIAATGAALAFLLRKPLARVLGRHG